MATQSKIRTVLIPMGEGLQKISNVLEAHAQRNYLPMASAHVQSMNGPGALLVILGHVSDDEAAEGNELPSDTTTQPESEPFPSPQDPVKPVASPLPEPEIVKAPEHIASGSQP
jgi:hypothetical protein